MTNITLKQLRYFEALVRHGHFGRAAEDCAITQPALSMQIRDLEQELGGDLFERGPRSVRLTQLGERLKAHARSVLHAVDELEQAARAARDSLTGRLRLGVIPTIAPYLLPSVIGRIMQASDEIDLQVRETLTQRIVAELADGKLDAAIVALPVSEPSLTEVALFSEEFVLVRPQGDAEKPLPDRDNLKEMRLLLLEEGHCFRDQALSFCSMKSALPRETLDGSSLTTLVQMVAAGLGVTLIPEMAVPVETRSAPVDVARFAPPKPVRTIGMIWRKSNPLDARLREIADLVRMAASG